MFTYTQVVVLGLLQGVAELFPISSLGHTVLLPSVLGWRIDQASPQFVTLVVLTHLATALVLLGFFWRDWLNIVRGLLRSLWSRKVGVGDTYARLGWLLVWGTIPAGLLGLVFEKRLTLLFANPKLVALVLVCNGAVLYVAQRFSVHNQSRVSAILAESIDESLAKKLSFKKVLGIGLAQCVALVPGFSRTGLTMTGGLASGLSNKDAVRFSFLLATPIIFAAALLKVPHLFKEDMATMGQSLLGALCAALAAYLSVRFLTKYFEDKTLTPFAVYCVFAGAAALLFLS